MKRRELLQTGLAASGACLLTGRVPSELAPSSKVIDKPAEIDLDQAKRDHPHVVAGTPGSEILAGPFAKRA